MATRNLNSLYDLTKRRVKSLSAQPAGVNVATPDPAPAAPAVGTANTNASRLQGTSGIAAAQSLTPTAPPAPQAPRYNLNFDASKLAPASGPSAGAPDPRDAIYWADVAKLKFQGSQAASQALFQTETENIERERGLSDLAQQRALQDRSTRQALSAGNLGRSTTGFERFAREEGAHGQNVSRREEDFDRYVQAQQAALNALQQGFSVEEAAAYAQAAFRYAEQQARNATDAPPDPAAPAAAAPYQPPPPGLKPGPAAGPPPSSNHWWTGTRWVPIGKAVPASHGNYASGPPPSKNHAWDGRRWVKVK